MVLVHGLGVVGISRVLNLEEANRKAHKLDLGALTLLTVMALSLFILHGIEIWLFAGFYIAGPVHPICCRRDPGASPLKPALTL